VIRSHYIVTITSFSHSVLAISIISTIYNHEKEMETKNGVIINRYIIIIRHNLSYNLTNV